MSVFITLAIECKLDYHLNDFIFVEVFVKLFEALQNLKQVTEAEMIELSIIVDEDMLESMDQEVIKLMDIVRR